MAAPRGPVAECDDAYLRRALADARRDGNLALAADADRRSAAIRVAPPPSFRYVALAPAGQAGGDGGPRAIPGAMFHRQYALCLDTLELTLHGYCVQRRAGWARRMEPIFSTRPPLLWRRLLGPPPLLALTVRAGAGAASVHLAVAPPAAAPSAAVVVRLAPALQTELSRLHAGAPRRPSLAARALAWLLRRPRA
ncbi:hypothetical protein NHH82_16370 [Oxalobacteraceae bacterium OTU3REALA1]|nr:hypothetical protein NHH82_16370 [Oxalobacteraceae bacterium OTU3REALA1]